jgi:hypothetical protein
MRRRSCRTRNRRRRWCRCVDCPVSPEAIRRQIAADRRHDAVFAEHVRDVIVGRGNHSTVLDEQSHGRWGIAIIAGIAKIAIIRIQSSECRVQNSKFGIQFRRFWQFWQLWQFNRGSSFARRPCSRRTPPSAPCRNRSRLVPFRAAPHQWLSCRRMECALRRRPLAS